MHELEGIVAVLLAVGWPIYLGIRYGHPEARMQPAYGRYAERPTVPVESPVEIVEVPIGTVPSHVGQKRPTLYVAR